MLTTVSDDASAELASAAGADVVLRRGPAVADRVRAAAPDGVDRVVEVALGANIFLDLAVLAPHGTVSTYADDVVGDVPVRELMVLNASLDFVLVNGIGEPALAAAVAGVAGAVAEGALPPLPAVRFALADIAAAHDAVQAGGRRGKVLLDLP